MRHSRRDSFSRERNVSSHARSSNLTWHPPDLGSGGVLSSGYDRHVREGTATVDSGYRLRSQSKAQASSPAVSVSNTVLTFLRTTPFVGSPTDHAADTSGFVTKISFFPPTHPRDEPKLSGNGYGLEARR